MLALNPTLPHHSIIQPMTGSLPPRLFLLPPRLIDPEQQLQSSFSTFPPLSRLPTPTKNTALSLSNNQRS